MKFLNLLSLLVVSISCFPQQPGRKPCAANPIYRQFDFWIGDWDVYALNGKKAGDSRIELILDSCVILENWISSTPSQGTIYSGKSFNKYNSATKQWQQTWVDNVGGSTEYLEGKYEDNKLIFMTKPFVFSKDTMAIRKLTFYNLSPDRVRQHGEISKNDNGSWQTEYDLEYRRKK